MLHTTMFNTPPPIPLEQAGLGIDLDLHEGSSPRSTLPGSSASSKPSLEPLALPMLALERASSWPMKKSPTLSPSNAGNKDAPSLTSPLPPLSPISPFSSSSSLRVPKKDDDNTYLETKHLHVAYADAPNKRFRPTMEDKVVLAPLRCTGTFVGVYDGHGGRWVADHVGETLHKHFDMHLQENNGCDEEEAFRYAYHAVDEELRIQRALTIGSTSVTAYFDPAGRYIVCANAGDSRCVIGKTSGTGKRLTVDHRPVLSEERNRINEGGSFVCGGRVNGILAISRALGDHAMKSVVIATPHTTTYPIDRTTDRFAVIACDGLWDVVEDNEAARFVNKVIEQTANISKDIVAKEAAKALVQLALEKGSTDNVSVAVVLLK